MQPDRLIILIPLTLLSLDVVLLCATLMVKASSRKLHRRISHWQEEISRLFANLTDEKEPVLTNLDIPRNERKAFLAAWHEHSQWIDLDAKNILIFQNIIRPWNLTERSDRLLSSPFFRKRVLGCKLLDSIDTSSALTLIQRHLPHEKNPLLMLRLIAIGLARSGSEIMGEVVAVYKRVTPRIQHRIELLIQRGSFAIDTWVEANHNSLDPGLRRIVLAAVAQGTNSWSEPFVASCIASEDRELADRAYRIAAECYPTLVNIENFLESEDGHTREAGAKALLTGDQLPDMHILSRLLIDDALRPMAVEALRLKLHANGRYIDTFFNFYKNATDHRERAAFADVLEMRFPYFLRKSDKDDTGDIARLIQDIVSHGHYAAVITFLNNNKDASRGEFIHRALVPLLKENPKFLRQCQLYLNPSILSEWDISSEIHGAAPKRAELAPSEKRFLGILLTITLVLIPIGFLIHYESRLTFLYFEEIITAFLHYFQRFFIIYAVLINVVTLVLLFFSSRNIRIQASEWSLADKRFLFAPGILPSVSILVPAFNEEKTIVQSVHSLLALEYPDFEVIVVNDGSTDRTLNELIEHFSLELSDQIGEQAIESAPVIGIYRSRSIQNLVLINKMNGGKADSLNAGISIANREYICSIDADSLLEPDSLQRILFRTIATDREVVGVGGNIIPVNGCVTSLGSLKAIHFPRNPYARYQAVEYLRSFIAGRMGWARIQSLLIISGAFGVFKRERVLEAGGYLTRKNILRRDTVGEDMELVVRLSKLMKKSGTPYLIDYAHNANCWTEVPEDLDSLVKQRDRWHRGLLETMVIHKDMAFNPRYKALGMIALPYFYIFEMLGPFLEFTGYIVFFLSFFLGLLSITTINLIFSAVVLLGILVSLSALYLSEHGVIYFKLKDFFSITRVSIMENLGYRQYISILRVFSYLSFLLRVDKGWQKLGRKGFKDGTQ